MPVSLVITELDVGGAEKALVSLATGLDRSRWAPTVIALGPEAPLAAPLREAGIPVECLAISARSPIRAIRTLADALRRRQPKLIQSFLFHANVASRIAAHLAFRPVVPWIVGGLRVAERRPSGRWHLRLDRWTHRLASGSVCVSEGVKRFTSAIGGIPEDRLVVIPNGVDPTPFDLAEPLPRPELGSSDFETLLLFIGRLDPQKGITHLLDAAEGLAARRNDWRLVLIGDGPLRPEIESRLASSPALARHVDPIGRREDIAAALRCADAFVLPSLWEGMPNVVLEAMAARLPVIATRVEGSENLVVPGSTGWLVPPADAHALADAMCEAIQRPDLRRSYGESARARIEAEFTPRRVVEAYDELWSNLLGIS